MECSSQTNQTTVISLVVFFRSTFVLRQVTAQMDQGGNHKTAERQIKDGLT
jgi:hypothetical protein